MQARTLIDAVYDRLTADQSAGSLYDDLGGRIYFVRGPQNAALPLLIFRVQTDEPLYYLDRATGAQTYANGPDVDAELHLVLVGSTAAGAAALEDINTKLLTLLHGQPISVTGYNAGQTFCIERGAPAADEDAVRITTRWRVWASVRTAG
jgi:hypothetical protein